MLRPPKRLLRSRLPLVLAVGLIAFMGVMAARIQISEDIRPMLPDHLDGLKDDYEMVLQCAPFARTVVIDLAAASSADSEQLHRTADRLAEAMTEPWFSRVSAGIDQRDQLGIMEWVLQRMPNLFTADDAAAIETLFAGDALEAKLQENLRQLLGPESLATKQFIQRDPLAIRNRVLMRMMQVNLAPNVRIQEGHFTSPDGLGVLLFAETEIPMTDAGGAKRLVDHISQLLDTHVPPNLSARFICGHRYTVANAETIKADMVRVFGVSAAGLILIVLVFMRHWTVLWVILVPATAVVVATGACAMIFETVSAATIGFGAALMGIAADFALHVYFAIRGERTQPHEVLGRLIRPLLLCAATTAGVFAVLLTSSLPLQRQLATFSIVGLLWALLAAVFVLPHLIRPARREQSPLRLPTAAPRVIVAVWVVVAGAGALLATGVQFDGSLRKVGMTPEAILADEYGIRDTWGNLKDWAMIVVSSDDMQSALQTNETVYRRLSGALEAGSWISTAALVPSMRTQQENLRRWGEFWVQAGRTDQLRQALAAAGFVPGAFDGFFERVASPPDTFAPEALVDSGFDDLIRRLILHRNDAVHVLSLLPDTPEMAAAFGAGRPIPGVRLLSGGRMARQLEQLIAADCIRFMLLAAIGVTVLLGLLFRRVSTVLLALMPVATGVVCMAGIMAATGHALNLFNMAAGLLVIGMSVDYGIFMAHRATADAPPALERAVLVSGLTTLAGFGSLTLAGHPAMQSIGMTVLFGIAPALATALIVTPAVAACIRPARGS